MIREYLKLSRSFNAGLTAVAPVLGAISMGEGNVFLLFLVFLVGFFGHIYGCVVNDIIDLKVDVLSEDLKERPLVSGKISKRAAWIFALSSMAIAFIIGIILGINYSGFLPISFLILSAASITTYDFISKKYPATDFFMAGGIFMLILYGASSINWPVSELSWFVCFLGTMQVLFMNLIAGGFKDVEHDFKAKANTVAIRMGVRIKNSHLSIPQKFKTLAYGIQSADIVLLFLPFMLIGELQPQYFQIFLLALLSILMLLVSRELLGMEKFDRDRARKLIAAHYCINFSLVPIMLMALNPWVGLLAFIPPVGSILSNLTLHGTLFPKTM